MTSSAETPKLPEARLRKPQVRFTCTCYWSISGGLAILLLIGCSKNRCPWGADLAGSAPPNGNKQWCQKQDSTGNFVKNGWEREWYSNGQLESEGIFDNDYLNEVTIWNEEGHLSGHAFFDKGVPKQSDLFDSDGHKVSSIRVTAEYLANTKPTRGLAPMTEFAHIGPTFANANLTVFDSAGDAIMRWNAQSDSITLLSAGDPVASCPVKGVNLDECTPTWPDKNNLAKIKHAVEAFKHMLQVSGSGTPAN